MVLGVLVALAAFAPGAPAAENAQDGPTPPKVSDPVGTNISPHGGYSSTSGACYQCHNVHNNPSASLPATSSVTATCATCHGYQGNAATGARNPGFGSNLGTASSRAVYEVTTGGGGEHTIGADEVAGEPLDANGEYAGPVITEGGFSYGGVFTTATEEAGPGTSSRTAGGLYCASCHTPHGEKGYAVNTEKTGVWSSDATGSASTLNWRQWKEGAQTWWKNTSGSWKYSQIHYDSDPGVWEMCPFPSPIATPTPSPMATPSPIAGAADAGCFYAQTKDQAGQVVSWYAYKLLAAFPNHQYTYVQTSPTPIAKGWSWGADYRDHDQPKWCGVCHESRVDTAYGGVNHTHPTGCTACHTNPGDGSSKDWPHTSTKAALLKDLPDSLCVTCHLASGKSLP